MRIGFLSVLNMPCKDVMYKMFFFKNYKIENKMCSVVSDVSFFLGNPVHKVSNYFCHANQFVDIKVVFVRLYKENVCENEAKKA